MAIRNDNANISKTEENAVASIQPVSFNGVNFRKTNLYSNNDAHVPVIEFARKKALENNTTADEHGNTVVDVNSLYTVRIYGDKPKADTAAFVPLF